MPRPPASIIIDRLYIEGGADVVGGLNMQINRKESPFWLDRENDYPSLLKWISIQAIVFYDVSERRAWLVDGASALLHLVRISLHLDRNDFDSPYHWVFEPSQLKDASAGLSGRASALEVLKSWENLDLKVYVKDRMERDGKNVESFSTFRERVNKILRSIEILIDRQVVMASQDGIKIPQKLELRRTLVGFDVLDIVSPLGPINPRVKQLPSWGDSWIDITQPIGISTVFGNGFGDLIRPDDPGTVCSQWKSIPIGMDYLTTSASTLKMLYEKRLLRAEPTLGVGEVTSKIIWSSSQHPYDHCGCTSNRLVNRKETEHSDPVQFLVSKKAWKSHLMRRGLTPVNLAQLEKNGAVIFGHLSLLGRRKDQRRIARYTETEEASTGEDSTCSREGLGSSVSGSVESQSTKPTSVNSPISASLIETRQRNTSPEAEQKQSRRKWLRSLNKRFMKQK